MQHIATFLLAPRCAHLTTLLHVLGVVGSNLKVKFNLQHLWMLHDVVSFGQVRATSLRPILRTSSIFNTQNEATYRIRVAKRTQHVAPNNFAMCCVQMLQSFGHHHHHHYHHRRRRRHHYYYDCYYFCNNQCL